MENYKLIDTSKWQRNSYFNHFLDKVECSYSLTVTLDLTTLLAKLKQKELKLYPVLIFCLTKIVNEHEEFRMFIRDGRPAVWSYLNPSFTIFHKRNESFSSLWTPWNDDFELFYTQYKRIIQLYGDIESLYPQIDFPENTFPISSLPWISFQSFNLNVTSKDAYLSPIFTWAKYEKKDDRIVIPLAIQVHHAVCDGFHVSRLVKELQDEFNSFLE